MGHQRLCRQACPPGGWWAGFCCKAPALWAWLLRPNRIEPQYVRRRSQRYKCTGPRPLVAIDRRSSARCSLLISTFILQNKIGICYVVRLACLVINITFPIRPRLGWDLRYHVGVCSTYKVYIKKHLRIKCEIYLAECLLQFADDEIYKVNCFGPTKHISINN